MRTRVQPSARPGRNDLYAILVPKGKRPQLPDTAPPPATWKADFGDEKGSCVLLRGGGGRRWLLVRLPEPKEAGCDDVRDAAGKARREAERLERANLVVDLGLLKEPADCVQAAAEGAGMAGYDMAVCKSDRKKPHVKVLTIVGAGRSRAVQRAAAHGALAAEANLFARDLQNLPPNVLNPKEFARRARQVARKHPRMSVKVLGRRQLEELGAGAFLGVAEGSANEPQLVHLVYKPARGKSKGKLALVGKGLTFDSGGISLKPSAKMDEMKFDMSGAAAVLATFHALANGAECAYEVHGILGCAENMPDGKAQRPGDIVKAMNGKTIEVLNTDAEGRLVLADCLAYVAKKVKPESIYDMATLTGAAIIALGHLKSAVLGNDQKLIDDLCARAERAGEPVWQLPLDDDYRDLTRGSYADLQNIYPAGQGAGTIAGASFLSFFVDDIPWVHLDIAATAWEGPSRSYYSKGGRGVMVRTMLELLRG